MDRILISWIAFKNDFLPNKEGIPKIDKKGPTSSFHHYFFDGYKKHLILSAAKESDTRLEFLINSLNRQFPNHVVEPVYLSLNDVINLELIISKIEPLLLSLRNTQVDIFISPGTPAMQTAWMLSHWTLNLNTRLIQVRPKQFTKKKDKPERVFINLDRLNTTASLIIKQSLTENKNEQIIRNEEKLFTSAIMKPYYDRAYLISRANDTTVLIQGETGTGKEHFAQFIHDNSARRDSPFLAVNCSALNDTLLESRLFGFKKGAFTDAHEDRKGIIERANHGTVFLDEIGDISPYMQQSLLRVLQEKEVTPIGGRSKKVDIRFIAATNKELLKMCRDGNFRWDLYYRLAVVDIELPSLRERGAKELKQLIQFFLKSKKKTFGASKMLEISKEVMIRLISYSFPGNIRELENLIERFYVLNTDGVVKLENLPKVILNSKESFSLRMEDVEREHIKKVLRMFNYNLSKTKDAIGIAYNTLRSKIEKYGIVFPEGYK